jgi:hypothetical protein
MQHRQIFAGDQSPEKSYGETRQSFQRAGVIALLGECALRITPFHTFRPRAEVGCQQSPLHIIPMKAPTVIMGYCFKTEVHERRISQLREALNEMRHVICERIAHGMLRRVARYEYPVQNFSRLYRFDQDPPVR